MLDIEMLEHYETDRAAKIFLRDGFVAVRNVLVGDQFNQTKNASEKVIQQIIDKDPALAGNRGHHRYSFGNQMHHIEWCNLTTPAVNSILEAIWNSDQFICAGNGGDFHFLVQRFSHYIPMVMNWDF